VRLGKNKPHQGQHRKEPKAGGAHPKEKKSEAIGRKNLTGKKTNLSYRAKSRRQRAGIKGQKKLTCLAASHNGGTEKILGGALDVPLAFSNPNQFYITYALPIYVKTRYSCYWLDIFRSQIWIKNEFNFV